MLSKDGMRANPLAHHQFDRVRRHFQLANPPANYCIVLFERHKYATILYFKSEHIQIKFQLLILIE